MDISYQEYIVSRPQLGELVQSARARQALPKRNARYWVRLGAGLYLGYRNATEKPTWQARGRLKERRYRYEILGYADDAWEADGDTALSYQQAADAARSWFGSLGNAAWMSPAVRALSVPEPDPDGPYTVAHAIIEYMHWYKANRRGVRAVFHGFKTHILPYLGHRPVADLTTGEIAAWFEDRSTAPRFIRAQPHLPIKLAAPPRTSEERRSRANNANRLLAFLKAALNHAFCAGKIDSDLAWRRVRKHRNVDKPRTRYLTREECSRLLGACPADLRSLISAALMTGCRPSELISLRVGDFIAETGRLLLETTKTGRPRTVALTAEGVRFFQEAVAGRAPSERLLIRSDGSAWPHYARLFQQACEDAEISPPANFYVLRHTYATHAILSGVPMIVVARQLGHSTTRMVEKHYGHFGQDFVDAHIKASMPNLCACG